MKFFAPLKMKILSQTYYASQNHIPAKISLKADEPVRHNK